MASVSGEEIALATNVLNDNLNQMDLGDGAGFAACYAENGTLRVCLTDGTCRGRVEIAAMGEKLHEKFSLCKHWEGNVCVKRGEDGKLTNHSLWKALNGGEVVSTGTHDDVLVKQEDGSWLIESRVIKHTWTAAGGHIK